VYKKLIRNSPIFIVWFLFYFYFAVKLLGNNILLVLFLYAISIAIALSSLGETILRFLEKIRPLYTSQEKEYLIPLFKEIYNEAKRKHPELGKVEICVVDSMTINTYAIGKRTIAVTKGAVETFNEDEIKALMAHELAHIINGDTIVTLLSTIGNGVFTVFVLIIESAITASEIIDEGPSADLMKSMTKVIKVIFSVIVFIIMFVGNIILSVNSRASEYRADKFSYELGYGQDMVSALYLLEKVSLSDNSTITDRMTASHPIIAKRIGKIETLLDTEELSMKIFN